MRTSGLLLLISMRIGDATTLTLGEKHIVCIDLTLESTKFWELCSLNHDLGAWL